MVMMYLSIYPFPLFKEKKMFKTHLINGIEISGADVSPYIFKI